MELFEWWGGLSPWVRFGVSLVFLLVAGVLACFDGAVVQRGVLALGMGGRRRPAAVLLSVPSRAEGVSRLLSRIRFWHFTRERKL